MRHVLMVVSTFVLALALAHAPPASAQQSDRHDATVEALRAVISHRLLVQGDSTRFDACILSGFLGGLDALTESLGPLAERAFVNPTDPCAEEADRRVDLFSMRLAGSAMQVRLRVLELDDWHFEDYRLSPPPAFLDGPIRWIVEDVRRY